MKETIQKVWTFLRLHRFACIAVAGALLTILLLTIVSLLATPIRIYDSGNAITVHTFSKNVDAILEREGIVLGPYDRVRANVESGTIRILRAFTVTADIDGEKRTIEIADATVADVQKRCGLDSSYHPIDHTADTPVKAGDVIRFTAYTTTVRVENEVVLHEHELVYTTDIPAGGRETTVEGVDGLQTFTYRDFYENGKLIKTETISQVMTKQPVTEVSRVGAGSLSVAQIPIELDENGHPVQYKEVLTGNACAYYFKKGTLTATGKQCKNGVVAVDPVVIPYGSKLFIIADDGYVYGYAEAVDSGEAVRDRIIIVDLFMESYKQTCQFGKRHVSVYILE